MGLVKLSGVKCKINLKGSPLLKDNQGKPIATGGEPKDNEGKPIKAGGEPKDNEK